MLALLLIAAAPPIAAQNRAAEPQVMANWRPSQWQQDTRPWRQQAQAAKLQEVEIRQLERDGLVIAGPTLLQSFQPYIGASLPVFVTSDAVLNAFHVLLEQSLVGVEHADARRLRTLVHGLRDGLDNPPLTIRGRPELTDTAVRRARLVLGVALALMGDPPRVLVGERALVVEEVALVEAARAASKPSWLGAPDAGFLAIDYSRFRPRGFHAGDPVLERAFRAREWLQSLPLRPDRDEELLMFAILQEISQDNSSYGSLPTDSAGLLGGEDDVDAVSFNDGMHVDGPSELAYLRQRYTRERGRSSISDQIHSGISERTLRILSTSRIPDSRVFARDPSRQTLPSGLEIAAALGSPVAAGGIEGGAPLLGSLRGPDKLKNLGHYGAYLETLAALLDPPDPDAPPVFGSRTWQAKSCGTVLAGWAQMRHALLSHVRESYTIGGMALTPSGFVEPNPTFFSRLATLAERLQFSLEQAGAFGVESSQRIAELRGQVKRLEITIGRQDERLRLAVASLVESLRNAGENVPDRTPSVLLAQARELLARPDGQGDPAEEQSGLRDLWYRLALVSRRLEALAHAQLRGRATSADDESFLKQIGEELAGIMLYVSNTYEAPRDEAPRIVDVATDPAKGLHLEVGIARPRTLYLLYPWQGREVLTQGAFLPYREFASSRRLTNDEWRKQLDQGGPPATACTSPIELPPRPPR